MTDNKTYSVLDIVLQKAHNHRITFYNRAPDCRLPTMRHLWGTGSFTSWHFAWRTNPSGLRPCGCVLEHGGVPA